MANNHGGKRQGAGRKPGSVKTLAVQAEKSLNQTMAASVLALSDEEESWLALLSATVTTSVAIIYPDGKPEGAPEREVITVPDNKIRLEARKYLTDKRDGKAHTAQNPHAPGKTNPADDPRLGELLARFRPTGVTVTQTTITGDQQPALPAPPTIEQRLT